MYSPSPAWTRRLDPDAGKVALVGHSGGDAVGYAAADARPDRVARVVYVDCWPAGDGNAINAGAAGRERRGSATRLVDVRRRGSPRPERRPNLQELGKLRDVEYVDLPTGHRPQFTKPDDLATVIVKAVVRPAGSAWAQG